MRTIMVLIMHMATLTMIDTISLCSGSHSGSGSGSGFASGSATGVGAASKTQLPLLSLIGLRFRVLVRLRTWFPAWLLPVSLLALCAMPVAAAEGGSAAVYESDSSFDDVMDGLRLAIEERGLFINNIMHMSEMLERTGADLGADRPLFGQAHSVEFCSAVLSRRMIAEDPSRVVNCPFIIAVYTLPDEPDKTFVAHRRFGADEVSGSEVMGEVAAMLKNISEQAVSW
ncbi:hypothetical protein Thiosp_00071 [Thiorhodovibrio litoralis]|nr:hypothetical protein Thiosp_00071 [Thiorhodovibrio litoralis]